MKKTKETDEKELYRNEIIEMVGKIENKDYLVRIYSFVKCKYDKTVNKE